jgi:hypothetical protein
MIYCYPGFYPELDAKVYKAVVICYSGFVYDSGTRRKYPTPGDREPVVPDVH